MVPNGWTGGPVRGLLAKLGGITADLVIIRFIGPCGRRRYLKSLGLFAITMIINSDFRMRNLQHSDDLFFI